MREMSVDCLFLLRFGGSLQRRKETSVRRRRRRQSSCSGGGGRVGRVGRAGRVGGVGRGCAMPPLGRGGRARLHRRGQELVLLASHVEGQTVLRLHSALLLGGATRWSRKPSNLPRS